jgi:hypothetical protein
LAILKKKNSAAISGRQNLPEITPVDCYLIARRNTVNLLIC